MKWRPIKTAPEDKIILLAEPPINHHEYMWTVMQGRWIDIPHTNSIDNVGCGWAVITGLWSLMARDWTASRAIKSAHS